MKKNLIARFLLKCQMESATCYVAVLCEVDHVAGTHATCELIWFHIIILNMNVYWHKICLENNSGCVISVTKRNKHIGVEFNALRKI